MNDEITKEKVDELLTHTESLINHIYWFKQDLNLQPSKEHIGTAINYTDIQERKDDFLKELVNTVASWVYSKAKSKQIVDERLSKVDFDYGNAYSFLTTQAFSKFRPGQPQGQFGELLLFNFIQYFFMAAPLFRKQRITTSIGHERYGAITGKTATEIIYDSADATKIHMGLTNWKQAPDGKIIIEVLYANENN